MQGRSVSARPKKPRLFPTEDDEQIELIAWARACVGIYPPLKYLFHCPNGGSRHVLEAIKFRKLGVLPGVPDLILLHPARGKFGWLGELKAKDGKLTEPQRAMLKHLDELGYYANAFWGWESARESLVWYLTGSEGI